jgi:hypothetical protein
MYAMGCWHGVCAYINKRKTFTGESRKNKTHTQTTIMSETKKNYFQNDKKAAVRQILKARWTVHKASTEYKLPYTTAKQRFLN